MAGYTGLGVGSFVRVTEVSRSGLPHCHSLGWRREVDTGPGSVAYLLGQLQEGKRGLTWEERGRVVQLGREAITVTTTGLALRQQFPLLTQQKVEELVTLARRHQIHICSYHCYGSSPPGQKCGQYFPKLPSLLPLLAVRPVLETKEQKENLEGLENIAQKVQELLRGLPFPIPGGEDDSVASLLSLLRQVAAAPVTLPGGGYTWAGAQFTPDQELEHLLEECGALAETQEDKLLLTVYHRSITSRRHAKLLPVRQVSECWVVNFNPWQLLTARSNLEVDLVTHTLPHLHSYLTKGVTSQTIWEMAEEVESRGGGRMGDMAERLRQAGENGWKEVSLTEALYRLDSRLQLSVSNCYVVSVSVEPLSILLHLYSLR